MIDNFLTNILADSAQTVTREKMINDRLEYELKLASFRGGIPLQIFSPEVDREGYDIILSSDINLYYLQIKSTIRKNNRNQWTFPVHKSILRPNLLYCDRYRIDLADSGLGGGILLIVFSVNNNTLEFSYYFTSYEIIKLKVLEMIDSTAQMDKILVIVNALFDRGNKELTLSKACFVKLKGPDELLAICGLHSKYDDMQWMTDVSRLIGMSMNPNDCEYMLLKDEIISMIDRLCAIK